MIRNELQERIVGAECAIEDVKLNLQLNNGISCTISSIDYAVSCITPLLEYEEQGIETLSPPPSECLKFLERKKYEIQDPDKIFKNLEAASCYNNCDLTKDYIFEDVSEIIEECKSSNNIYDKLALAIFYSNMGKEYYHDSISLFNEYLKTNPSNPCYTPVQLLYLLAEIHEKYEEYSKAIEVYMKLIDTNFDSPFLFEKMINVFVKMGRTDLAQETLDLAKRTENYQKDYFKYIIDKIEI